MENIRDVICKNCTRLIESSKMSQKTIASKVGVSEPTIYRWKSGENTPELANIEALANVLGVSTLEFYRTSEERAPIEMAPDIVLRKYLRVPNEIVELAQDFDPNDPVWGGVKTWLKDRIKDKQKEKSKNKQA
jgi:transcriptional regulator with XRE-family HTH domain